MRHAFTLIELLVVIAIVAVLAGMLLPTVRLVKDSAQTMRCIGHLRQFNIAAEAYAADWEGYLVPCSDATLTGGTWQGGNYAWGPFLNPYLDSMADSGGSNPSYYGSITKKNLSWGCTTWQGRDYGGGISYTSPGYGYNKNPGLPKVSNDNSLGDKLFSRGSIDNQSNRLMFADWNNWYLASWSPPGPTNYPTIQVLPNWVVAGGLRHRNGMNVCFFDGHTSTIAMATSKNCLTDPANYSP